MRQLFAFRPAPSLPSWIALSFLLIAMALTPAAAGQREDQRADDAIRVLTEIQNIPESAIPDKLLDEAHAIVIVPNVVKAGLVFGGRGGRGLLAVKTLEGTWSNPSFVTLAGGSVGFQAGIQFADVVLVFRNNRSLESIVNGKLTLGADAGVAAGPVGRNAAAATDGQFRAEIWSWSRARGLFAGIALDGAVLRIDHRANQSVYGRGSNARMIFEDRTAQPPSSAIANFRERLEEATAIARMVRGRNIPAQTGTLLPAPAQATDGPPPRTSAAPAANTPTAVFEPVDDTPVDDNPVRTDSLPLEDM